MSSSATISFARVSSGSATGIGGPHPVLGSSPAGSFTHQHHLLGSSPPVHSKHLLGSSPPVSSKQHLLGSSPPVTASCGVLGSGSQASKQQTGSDKQAPYAAAKKFLRRLQHDPALDPSEFTVGFVESVQQQVRQSGVGAWSMRVHDQVHDIPYPEFIARYPDEGDTPIPFHRIAYFKLHGSIVWEAEQHGRRRTHEGEPSCGGAGPISAAARPPRVSDSKGHALSLLGSSPAARYLANERSAACAASDGCTTEDDDEEVAEQLGSEDWDPDDMIAGQMEGDGLPTDTWQASQQQQQEGQREMQRERTLQQQQAEEEGREVQLPEQCWMSLLQRLAVRDVCMMGRVNRWLHQLSSTPALWYEQYVRIFAEPAPATFNAATVRRMCRRSEIRAARWLEADVAEQAMGYADTTCLQLDDSKVVSADGPSVRVWSHLSGRRLATLKGHPGVVTGVAYDDNYIVSGCSDGAVKVWGMDDLKPQRCTRRHDGGVSGVALLNGVPVTAGADGRVRLWDVSSPQPIMALDAPRGSPLLGLEVLSRSGYIVTCGDGVHIWDASTVQLLHDLGQAEMEREEAEAAWGPWNSLAAGLSGLGVAGDGAAMAAAEAQAAEALPLAPAALAPSPAAVNAAAPGLVGGGAAGSGAGGGPGAGAGAPGPERYRSVAYSGSVLAASLGRQAVVFDPRFAAAVGTVRAPATVSFPASSAPASASTSMSAHGVTADFSGARCVALALDDWKLAAAFNAPAASGNGVVAVYDMRAVPASRGPGGWSRERSVPLLVLPAPARINTVRFHNQFLLAGLAGAECGMWEFMAPGAKERDAPGVNRYGRGEQAGVNGAVQGGSYGTAATWGGEPYGRSPTGDRDLGGSPPGAASDGARRKGKPPKMVKKQNRFPKRSK